MKTQLFFDLIGDPGHPAIHFRDADEVEVVLTELQSQGIAVFEVDGAKIQSSEDLFKAFAVALKKPEGWYGAEQFAPNANAFLEYLDDVVEWVPAKGHVAMMRGAEQFWRTRTRLAGLLTEWWQSATVSRHATIHLVFVW